MRERQRAHPWAVVCNVEVVASRLGRVLARAIVGDPVAEVALRTNEGAWAETNITRLAQGVRLMKRAVRLWFTLTPSFTLVHLDKFASLLHIFPVAKVALRTNEGA